MKSLKLILTSIALSALLLLQVFCNNSKSGAAQADATAINTTDTTRENLRKMIGQMIMVGFRGDTVADTSAIVKNIKAGNVGGVILFDKDLLLKTKRNIISKEQLTELVGSLQTHSKNLPLLVSIDQEGGKIDRLKKEYGFSPTVAAEYLGKINHADTTKKYADAIAAELRAVGINLNFAPVVDVNTDATSPAIGKLQRSFSANPEIVTTHARLFIQSHHAHNVFTAIKHFPGHGSANADSHLGFVDVSGTWKPLELTPFAKLIAENQCDFVMTAHIYNRQLDSVYPATLSKNIITGLLRDSLHYNGVIISDDMQMKAIADHYGLEQSIKLAVLAGVDILLFGNNLGYDEHIPEKAINAIIGMVESGELTTERIAQSYGRIIALKRRKSR